MKLTRCSICLIPDTRPDTEFVEGVCSACITAAQLKLVNWEERKNDLFMILAAAKKNVDGYDCIVPSSGGKDSHWQVLKLIEYGMTPLVVTATTCMLTNVGRKNIDNLARFADTLEVTPNRRVRWKLNRLGLLTVGDISWPEHVAIFTTPFKISVDMGIPLIFYGENPQAAYGGPRGAEIERRMTRRWVSEYGGFLGMRPGDCYGQDGITMQDMEPYVPPSITELERVGTTAYFLGQFLPWDSHRNAKEALCHGMTQISPTDGNRWSHENLDNAMTGLHDWGGYVKYGYNRGCAQISVDIRNGLVDRETALSWVKTFDHRFPWTYMGVPVSHVAARIGMSPDALVGAFDLFTNWLLFTRRVDDGSYQPLMVDE